MGVEISNRIKECRLARGFTLEQLAAAAGTTNQQISMLENGKRQLTMTWLERLAAALKTPAAQIIGLAPVGSGADGHEAIPWTKWAEGDNEPDLVGMLYPGHSNVRLWQATTPSVTDLCILPGDMMIVDEAATPQAGDIVLANCIGPDGSERVVIRVCCAPYLLGNRTCDSELAPLFIDNVNVKLIGVVSVGVRHRQGVADAYQRSRM